MIEGITVLNKAKITEMSDTVTALVFIFIVIFIISFIITLSSNTLIFTISGSISILSIISLFVLALIPEVDSNRYRYECTIDPSVSFEDIYEKYEVKEQRGEIWVLEDKKEED